MLFRSPGQERFKFMWNDLVRGAVGAVILVDTRRLADGFVAIDYFEDRSIPFIIAVNQFDGAARYDRDAIQQALALENTVPIVMCDARDRGSCQQVLISLVNYALTQAVTRR